VWFGEDRPDPHSLAGAQAVTESVRGCALQSIILRAGKQPAVNRRYLSRGVKIGRRDARGEAERALGPAQIIGQPGDPNSTRSAAKHGDRAFRRSKAVRESSHKQWTMPAFRPKGFCPGPTSAAYLGAGEGITARPLHQGGPRHSRATPTRDGAADRAMGDGRATGTLISLPRDEAEGTVEAAAQKCRACGVREDLASSSPQRKAGSKIDKASEWA